MYLLFCNPTKDEFLLHANLFLFRFWGYWRVKNKYTSPPKSSYFRRSVWKCQNARINIKSSFTTESMCVQILVVIDLPHKQTLKTNRERMEEKCDLSMVLWSALPFQRASSWCCYCTFLWECPVLWWHPWSWPSGTWQWERCRCPCLPWAHRLTSFVLPPCTLWSCRKPQ